ncbi:PfkB family carbohydrate kinase [uncultured Varibaculum sp.]|uniref:PfkB family carbohydrate kinase n=1 Tax=uncultured Varibaculum sp. TaxID=413896 RepID=UPI0027D99999|nr:PfkB family carbohydrate kinase [uncultured Varibaculum sp.]
MTEEKNKLVSIAAVVLTLPLKVSRLPERGTTVLGSAERPGVGESAEVMMAAARQGVKVVNMSCLGTGPNSTQARQVLREANIETRTVEVVGDIGMKIQMIEEGGYYASVLTTGVEIDISARELDKASMHPGDVVYISAGDLAHTSYRAALSQWLPSLPEQVKVVMAATPQISQIEPQYVSEVLPYVDVLTCNEYESQFLPGSVGHLTCGYVVEKLPESAWVVERIGSYGAKLIDANRQTMVPSLSIKVADTLGVGSAHTGVLLAGLVKGLDPFEAIERANVAGAMAAEKHGNDTCPHESEIEQRLSEVPDYR